MWLTPECIYPWSVTTTHLCSCSMKEVTDNTQMNTYSYVPIKLYLQKRVVGHIWLNRCRLPTPDLNHYCCIAWIKWMTKQMNGPVNEWQPLWQQPAFSCFGPLSSVMNIHETARKSHHCMREKHHNHSLGLSEEHMGTNLTSVVFCSQDGSGEQCP